MLDGEVLCRDVHPAEVSLPDGKVLTGVRVFATSHRLLAYQADDREIRCVLDVALEQSGSVEPSGNSLIGALEIRTADGTVWVNRGQGCGCGSPLKNLAAPVPRSRR